MSISKFETSISKFEMDVAKFEMNIASLEMEISPLGRILQALVENSSNFTIFVTKDVHTKL